MSKAGLMATVLWIVAMRCVSVAQDVSRISIGFEMRAEKETVLPGEPCVLLLDFVNPGDRDVRVRLGSDAPMAKVFSVTRDDGESLTDLVGKTLNDSVPSPISTLLPAHGSVRRKVVLNRFLPAPLSEGAYTVTCGVSCSHVTSRTASCTLHVSSPNDAALSDTLQDVARAVVEGRDPGNLGGEEPSDFWMMQLVYSRTPAAIKPLGMLLSGNKLLYNREVEAIKGLERIGTRDAAKELVRVSEMPVEGSGRMFADAVQWESLRALGRLGKESKDPDVGRLCSEATRGKIASPPPIPAGWEVTAPVRVR